MPRKVTYEQALGTDKGISFDPLDGEIIEKLFKKDIREGEEKLMLAVLADAIDHFQKHAVAKDEKGRKLFQEAEEWFLEKDSDGLFSFEYVCDTLQLRPDYIRQGLLSWKKAKGKERSVQEHRADRKKFVKTRVAHTSVRRSKTA
jgi:hypothetical protein